MKKLLTIIIASLSLLNAQTHIVPEGFSGFSISFKNDRNLDFFGEGKFVRDSYANELGFSYVYDGIFGIDLNYAYSLFNRKEVYDFQVEDGASNSENQNFNFVKNFRTENADLGEKNFSIGFTYYLNESQSLFKQNLPLNISLGLGYGTKNYNSKALDFLNQDFYGKFYSLQVGIYKEIETNANFFIIPRFKISYNNEKNIYDIFQLNVDSNNFEKIGTNSFNVSSTLIEIAVPFMLNNTSIGQPFIEPSIQNKYGTTHIGLRFGFLF